MSVRSSVLARATCKTGGNGGAGIQINNRLSARAVGAKKAERLNAKAFRTKACKLPNFSTKGVFCPCDKKPSKNCLQDVRKCGLSIALSRVIPTETHAHQHTNTPPRRRPFCRKSIFRAMLAGVQVWAGVGAGLGACAGAGGTAWHQTVTKPPPHTATRGNAGKTLCGRWNA